jgi:hypothetical protein
LKNSNAYALSNAALTDTLPSGLTIMSSPVPATTCGGSFSAAASAATMTGASLPASGSCTLTLSVESAAAGVYTNTIAANALTTTPAAGSSAAASAALTVTAPSKGGGALDWLDVMFAAGVLLAGRRYGRGGGRPHVPRHGRGDR